MNPLTQNNRIHLGIANMLYYPEDNSHSFPSKDNLWKVLELETCYMVLCYVTMLCVAMLCVTMLCVTMLCYYAMC